MPRQTALITINRRGQEKKKRKHIYIHWKGLQNNANMATVFLLTVRVI